MDVINIEFETGARPHGISGIRPSRRATRPRSPQYALDTLGTYLREIRERRGYSREQVAALLPISAVYLSQIETNKRIPTRTTAETIGLGYGLRSDQVRHILTLREPAEDIAEIDTLRRALHATQAAERLSESSRLGVLVGYFDPLWNVIEANDEFEAAFPGIRESSNLVAWHLTDTAQTVLPNWEDEASTMVWMLRAAIARHRKSLMAFQTLQRLTPDPHFRRWWPCDPTVAYTRHSEVVEVRRNVPNASLRAINIEDSTTTVGSHLVRIVRGITVQHNSP